MLEILQGVVVECRPPFARIRLLPTGVVSPVLTKKQYRYGERLVLLYDTIRDLIVETYTASEWELQTEKEEATMDDLTIIVEEPHEADPEQQAYWEEEWDQYYDREAELDDWQSPEWEDRHWGVSL